MHSSEASELAMRRYEEAHAALCSAAHSVDRIGFATSRLKLMMRVGNSVAQVGSKICTVPQALTAIKIHPVVQAVVGIVNIALDVCRLFTFNDVLLILKFIRWLVMPLLTIRGSRGLPSIVSNASNSMTMLGNSLRLRESEAG